MTNNFDPCDHQMRQLIIKAGREIRRLKGLPEERNITIIFEETAKILGMSFSQINSSMVSHLPAPYEMENIGGGFIVPRKDCPVCGQRNSVVLAPLCQNCEDAEGGKYKSVWKCITPNCAFKEKLEDFFAKICSGLGIEIPTGPKVDFGIRTLTDKGLE